MSSAAATRTIRHLYPDNEPSLLASAPDMLITAGADGFIRTYPTTGSTVSSTKPVCEFETVYPTVTFLTYCSVHDTVITIENRRGDDTGVVRVYYNWRLAASPGGDDSTALPSEPLKPAAPFPPTKRCGVPPKNYPLATELSVYRIASGASAVAVACCESTGRLVVASGRGHVSLWEVGRMYEGWREGGVGSLCLGVSPPHRSCVAWTPPIPYHIIPWPGSRAVYATNSTVAAVTPPIPLPTHQASAPGHHARHHPGVPPPYTRSPTALPPTQHPDRWPPTENT